MLGQRVTIDMRSPNHPSLRGAAPGYENAILETAYFGNLFAAAPEYHGVVSGAFNQTGGVPRFCKDPSFQIWDYNYSFLHDCPPFRSYLSPGYQGVNCVSAGV